MCSWLLLHTTCRTSTSTSAWAWADVTLASHNPTKQLPGPSIQPPQLSPNSSAPWTSGAWAPLKRAAVSAPWQNWGSQPPAFELPWCGGSPGPAHLCSVLVGSCPGDARTRGLLAAPCSGSQAHLLCTLPHYCGEGAAPARPRHGTAWHVHGAGCQHALLCKALVQQAGSVKGR